MKKSTHTIQDIEERWHKEIAIIKDPNTSKDQKKKAAKRAGYLDDFMRTIDYKHLNGKEYPVKKQPKDIPKKELLALINEVPDEEDNWCPVAIRIQDYNGKELDVSGVSVGSNRFTFKE